MNVVHNDIKPDNIFFRVSNDNATRFYISGKFEILFITLMAYLRQIHKCCYFWKYVDFNIATLKGKQIQAGTLKFASANFFSLFSRKRRYAMDDLESLSYSMCHVAGIPLGEWTWLFGVGIPEGFLLSRYTDKKRATIRVLDRLSNLENNAVREAFEFICVDEILSGKRVPDYNRIITELDQAIAEVANPTWSK